jgi:ketosteroid isomerase-like protein
LLIRYAPIDEYQKLINNHTNEHAMNPEEFLTVMAKTANNHDFAAHMNLISKDVQVYGVPNFDVINYNDWYNQCKKEFDDRLLHSISYVGLQILAEEPNRVMFAAVEIMEATDGHEIIYGIEFIIQKEEDGQWRVVQERILSGEGLEGDQPQDKLQ